MSAEFEAQLALKAAKPKLHMLTPEMQMAALPAVLFGAEKYRPWAWLAGMDFTSLADATQRHIIAWTHGEDNDQESGVCHLHHAAADIGFLLTYLNRGLGIDDRRIH